MCELAIVGISGKGGDGKSSISLNVSREIGCSIVTNDTLSKFPLICKEDEVTIFEELKFIEDVDCVYYDYAGVVDPSMKEIVKRANVVVYIATGDTLSYSQVAEYINDLLPYNKNSFVIANRLGAKPNDGENKTQCIDREFNLIKKEIGEQFNIEVYPLKFSKKFDEAFNQGMTLNELLDEAIQDENKKTTNKGAWSVELKQLEKIIDRIKG